MRAGDPPGRPLRQFSATWCGARWVLLGSSRASRHLYLRLGLARLVRADEHQQPGRHAATLQRGVSTILQIVVSRAWH